MPRSRAMTGDRARTGGGHGTPTAVTRTERPAVGRGVGKITVAPALIGFAVGAVHPLESTAVVPAV